MDAETRRSAASDTTEFVLPFVVPALRGAGGSQSLYKLTAFEESTSALAADNVGAIEARGGAYVLRDPDNGGAVVRSGRTINLGQREAQHLRDPALKDFDFDPVYRTDVYNEQRGLEQVLHDTYQPPLNKIRPISPNNKNIDTYTEAAIRYLGN